jgi:predicted RNA binding protein YcfA (HicA-like mRNA interferase family)
MTSKEVIKKLTDDGWVLRGIKGSHHIYTHQYKSGHISVPHPKKVT